MSFRKEHLAPLIRKNNIRNIFLKVLLQIDETFKHNILNNHYCVLPQKEKLKIILLGPTHFGDLLCMFPFFLHINRYYPNVELHVAGGSALQDLASFLKVNAIFHDVRVNPATNKIKIFFEIKKLIKKLNPDVGISYKYYSYHLYHLIQYLSGVPQRIGFCGKGIGFTLTMPVDYPWKTRYIDQLSILFFTLFNDDRLGNADLIYDEWLKEINIFFAPNNLQNSKKFIGISMIANHNCLWPVENWQKLLELILVKYEKTNIVIMGSEHKKCTEKIVNQIKFKYGENRIIDLSGKTSLIQVLETFKSIHCLITIDTGLRHLANLVGLPVVVLRPSDSFYSWSRYRDNEIILDAPQSCSPCGLANCKYSKIYCMENISVEKCLKSFEKIIE